MLSSSVYVFGRSIARHCHRRICCGAPSDVPLRPPTSLSSLCGRSSTELALHIPCLRGGSIASQPAASSWLAVRLSSAGQDSRSSFYTVATRLISMLHLDRCHVEQHVALSQLMAEWRVTWAADGNALQIASRVRRRAAPSRRASACRESACRAVCARAVRAWRWCAAAPATTDRNVNGPGGAMPDAGPGAQRRPPHRVHMF